MKYFFGIFTHKFYKGLFFFWKNKNENVATAKENILLLLVYFCNKKKVLNFAT